MSDLPRGWDESTLGEVCERPQYGWTTSARKNTGSGLRFLRTTDITAGYIEWATVPGCLHEPPNPEPYLLRSGDLVISRAGSVGFSQLIVDPPPAVFASYLIRFRPTQAVDGRFLAWFMQSPGYWRQVRASASGIALANVNARKLAAIRLPLPPRAEQERIATAIEEELSGIEGGLVSLGKVHQRIRAAKVATLAQAYEEARTAGSVSALRDVIGAGALFRDGDWVETKDQDPSGDCRLTQLADIGEGSWRNRSRRYMRRDQFERLGCEPLKANDVLIARMPDPLGRACLFPGDPMACTTAVDVAIIRVGENGPIPRWLMWMINAPQARRQINALRLGTTRQRISRKNLGSILVPSIARPLQEVQAQAIDTAMLALDRTTEAVENTRRGAGALRASLLAAAFRGELIPQHKGEEPASPIVAEAARRRVPPPAYLKARRRNAVPTKRSSHE